jgi:hypothetical protein
MGQAAQGKQGLEQGKRRHSQQERAGDLVSMASGESFDAKRVSATRH